MGNRLLRSVKYFLKVSFSSNWLWPVLFMSILLIELLNYFVSVVLFRLKIVDPNYIYFWTPAFYPDNSKGNYYVGLNSLFFVFYFLIVVFLLYYSNRKEKVKANFGLRAGVFICIYVFLSIPFNSGFSFVELLIPNRDELVFNFLEKMFLINYENETISTPDGIYKSYYKYNTQDLQNRYPPKMVYKCEEWIRKKRLGRCNIDPFSRNPSL